MPSIRIGKTSIGGGSGVAVWNPQRISSKVLFWGKVSEISEGQMPNKITGATDFLTVAGSPYTFQTPNTAPYIAADTDYIWFKTDASQRTTTTSELIGYDLPRTPVKYDDNSPNTLREIVILKAGEVLTADELNQLFKYMWLPIEWNNDTNAFGHIKDNRVGQNLWTPEAVYEEELNTYISGLVTPLSEGQKDNLNTFIAETKAGLSIASLEDAFDVIYVLGGETSESSLRNLVKRSHDATLQGTPNPSFTAFEGFVGNGTNGYLNTNYNGSTQAVNCLQNSAAMGVYSRSNVTENAVEAGVYISANGTYLMYKYGATRYGAFNSGEGERGTVINPTTGLLIGVRESGTSEKYYHNGSLLDNLTVESSAIKNLNEYILGYNNNGTPGALSTKQISFYFKARALSLAEVQTLTTAFEKYMDANGKGVIA